MNLTNPENLKASVDGDINFPFKSYADEHLTRDIVLFEDNFSGTLSKWRGEMTIVDDARTETGKAVDFGEGDWVESFPLDYISPDRISYRMELDLEVKHVEGQTAYLFFGMQGAEPTTYPALVNPGAAVLFGYYESPAYNNLFMGYPPWKTLGTNRNGYNKIVLEQIMTGPTSATMKIFQDGVLLSSEPRNNIGIGQLRPYFSKFGDFNHVRLAKIKVIKLL